MKRSSVIFSIVVTILLVLGSVGLFSYLQPNKQISIDDTSNSPPANWRKYTDIHTGFSIYYPDREGIGGEDLLEPIYTGTGYPKKNILFKHDNGSAYLFLRPFANLKDLSLEQGIRLEQALTRTMSPEKYSVWLQKDLSVNISYIEIAGRKALLLKQNENTLPLLGFCQYGIYIKHQEAIIAMSLCPASRTLELGYEAGLSGEALFFEILNTLEFFNPTATEGQQ